MSLQARVSLAVVAVAAVSVATALALTTRHRAAPPRTTPARASAGGDPAVYIAAVPSTASCENALTTPFPGPRGRPLATVDADPIKVVLLISYPGAPSECAIKTMRDATVANRLASAVRTAPELGDVWYGTISCPMDSGGWVNLYFVYARRRWAEFIHWDLTGCRQVGIGAPGRTERTSAKLSSVIETLDISPPLYPVRPS